MTHGSHSWFHLAPVWRSLIRRPGYTFAVVVTLAFGTGVTTTLFAVVETVLLRPLPYPDGDRLVTVYEASPNAPGRPSLVAPARIEDWQRATSAFASLSGTYSESVTDTSPVDPERLDGRRVTPRYFEVFGSAPIHGRTFTADEERAGGPLAVVISEPFWTRRFNRSPDTVGQTLTIGGAAHTIVGIMDHTFAATTIDVWLPAQLSAPLMQAREARFAGGIGRMKPGVTLEQARADLMTVQATLGEQFPSSDRGWSVILTDLREARVGSRRTALLLVFGAVGITWLVGVANIAGLVLVQTQRRTRELSIRTALGASRGQVVALIVQEMVLLAALGGAAGLFMSRGLLRLVPQVFDTLPRLNELSLDWRASAFAIGSSLTAAMLCAVWPALRATRRQTGVAQSAGSRGSTHAAHWSQRALVGLQVALGVVLCTSAAFLASSYYTLTAADLGVNADDVITFRVGARWDEDRTRVGQMQEALIARLQTMPGVTAAGITNFLPALVGGLRFQIKVDGLAGPDGTGFLSAGGRMISAGYLKALRVPLVTGAGCRPFRFDLNQPRVALVNRQFVDRYADAQNIVGRQLSIESIPGVFYTIAGVIENVAEDGAQAERAPFVYTCDSAGSWPDPQYVVRTSDAAAFGAQLRETVRSIDGTRAVFGVRSLAAHLDSSIAEPRLNAGVVTTFAVSTLLLGALGLYALFARLVAESRREIGVRLALGATPTGVVRLVVSDAGRILMAGLLVGAALSLGAHRLLRSSLEQSAAFDASALAVAAVLLATVSGIAILLPAVRASRIAPTDALRTEG